ncbi:MAG: hypothetical protein IKV05_03335 [Bacteroidales bacterium]|nr:hypothetical protein [Bacteroidales bacterium]
MKKTIFFLLSLLTFVSCYDDSELRKQMQDFEDRLTGLAGTVIASVDEQITGITSSIDSLKTVDAELEGYISALESQANDMEERLAALEETAGDVAAIELELATLKAAIEELKTADAALDSKISTLQTYVDDSLKSSKDWAESTFATLEQYDSLQTALSSLKVIVGQLGEDMATVEAGLDRQLTDAIADSESSMKAWVNEALAESCYDMATIDAKLAALEKAYKDADAALQKKIEDQQAALSQAKDELTKEYKAAITAAIEANNGQIDSKIADALKTAQEELQEQIGEILPVLEALEERLTLLESKLVSRIQSLVYVPEYSDGKVVVADAEGRFSLKFLVTPMKLASVLQTLWETDSKVITASLRYSKFPETKSSADDVVPLKVTSAAGSAQGFLSLTVSVDENHPLSAEFWDGEVPALVYINITDGNNDRTSDMIVLEGKRGGNAFPDHEELPLPEPGVPSDISRTANSYIISEAGSYSLKTVKGNSTESVGRVASVEVLWESFGTAQAPATGDLIASVSYSGGRIGFTTSETFREGNAVIAAKDASGNILWSWHIWMTDKPASQVYYNGAGTMMDRNLGATSATPGDVGALGLLYQWGRKDPFLGSSSISEPVVAASTITWPDAVQSDVASGTIDYAIANPTTFITSSNDWQAEPDNNRWMAAKTMFDPCPVGWRVPDGGEDGVWAEACGSSANINGYEYDSVNKGMDFSGKYGADDTIWYPVSGYINLSNASLNHAGVFGRYWSCTLSGGINPLRLGFGQNGSIFMTYDNYPADAHSVRCLKENSRTGGGSAGGEEPGGNPEGGSGEGNVDMGTAEDMTDEGRETANSYIITKSGQFKFRAYKGNSQELAGSQSSVDPVGEIAKAEVLWESFGTSETPLVGSLIEEVSYDAPYIGFKTADTFREGNALIAVKDASGNILWSWHIWMTDQPASQVYYNGAGTMMDRNLGATSATPGDVGALGLLYQWGRKDPFLGSSSISEAVVAASTITWPDAVQSDATSGTIDYAVANPMTFIVEEQYGDWQIEPDYNRWQSSKTIYDPCPVGWRVPDGGENGVWVDASGVVWYGKDYDFYDELNKGVDFTNVFSMDQMVWYPSAHCRAPYSGQLGRTYNWGVYWSCTYYNGYYDEPYSMGFTSDNLWNSTTYQAANGLSVRCLKDGSRTPSQDNPAPTPDSDPTPTPDPEPQSDDYIDEYGINHGQGVEIDGVVWAPVNCGYHATDYKWGKLYQWGRKYGQGYDEDASTPELIAGPVPVATGQSAGNAGKFYYSQSSPYNWVDVQNDNLWNAGTEENPVKTEYDPCPSGWRVPTYAELNKLRQNKSACTTNAAGQNGYWFSGMTAYSDTAPQVFFPAAGGLGGYYGYPVNRGGVGYYWSSRSYSLLRDTDIYSDYCTNGFSVRCVRE